MPLRGVNAVWRDRARQTATNPDAYPSETDELDELRRVRCPGLVVNRQHRINERLPIDRAQLDDLPTGCADRLGRLRLSPHVYNDEADCDRFVAVLRQALQ